MNQLNAAYSQAVEHTKNKIFEDIHHYLGKKLEMPTYEQFLIDRNHYIEQIWINVWLNVATNKVPRNEKKSFLSEQGYDVEGVDRKLINKLFRNEIRNYQPFDVMKWMDETFTNKDSVWVDQYQHARSEFQEREQERQNEERQKDLQNRITTIAQDLLEHDHKPFYLRVRYQMGKMLKRDMKHNKKYELTKSYRLHDKLLDVGPLDREDYTTVSDFLQELTGNRENLIYWGKDNYEFETYYDLYGKELTDFVFDTVPPLIMERIPLDLIQAYKELFKEDFTKSKLKKWLANTISNLVMEFATYLEEEQVDNLLKIADLDFDVETHEQFYRHDVLEREKRIAEEQAEIQRKQEEEARILLDIFGREYSPSFGTRIKYVLHIGETNTGKTHHALERMKQAKSGQYLAPLRLLALEVYDKLNNDGIPCSLKTGEEEKEVTGSTHISCTVEMFHEKEFFEVVVIDEAQMIADKDRGFSWYKAITQANANEVHIIGSQNLKGMMIQLLGESNMEIIEYSRDIPLEVETSNFHIKHVKKGDALVCFSRRRVLETSSRLQNDGHSVSMIYGSMPPETRKKQMQRFINGETSVIVSTDAIGMGLNLPIRRIVFLENEKFDGTRRRRLSSQEVKQIAGRAGRKGIYDVGKVAFTKDIKEMRRLLEKTDRPVKIFAIAPTNQVFERFQRYSRNLGDFFELWSKFESPPGTEKASLTEEYELYETIRDSDIEARLSMMDLYGFLHLPFSSNEPTLKKQWKNTMKAIVSGDELPEPIIKRKNLEELELSYKALGLHLLFLYRMEMRTETYYWEKVREELSDEVHERLKTDVKKMTKKCKQCGRKLQWDYPYQICQSCHMARYRKRYDDFE